VTANITTGTAVVKVDQDDDSLKFTAALVESDRCPKLLQTLQKQIAAHLDKADKYEEKAEQHRTSAGQLFAQVQELCDEGGFAAFHEKFFPDLGRSRTYELLAIGTGRKSIDEIRASTRERVARYRANKALSVTVTDDPASPEKVESEDGEDSSITQRRAEHAVLFAEPSDSAALKSTGMAGDNDGHSGGGNGHIDAGVEVSAPAPSTTKAPNRSKRANGRPDKSEAETLIEHWRRDPEKQAEIIQGESIQHLVELMSADQRDELLDRIVRQQLAQASSVAMSKSKQRLLKNLTCTFHWGIGQDDPVNGAQCLKIIAAKLAVNKHSGKDICFAFAKPTRR
jgi:hypothetical protein